MTKNEDQIIKATLSAFGPDEGVTFTQDTWAKLHAAMSAVVAQPAPVQEPVAYLCENAVGHKYFRWKKPSSEFKPIALYTTPPAQPAPVQEPDHSDELTIAYMSGVHRGKELAAQRQWVGLTDELRAGAEPMFFCGAKWAERILKEKNT